MGEMVKTHIRCEVRSDKIMNNYAGRKLLVAYAGINPLESNFKKRAK
jgi:hypothetical protein